MSSASAKSNWTVRVLNSTTLLIRETDNFGEYPNIYARLVSTSSGSWEYPNIYARLVSTSESSSPIPKSLPGIQPDAILLLDTGCGTKTTVKPQDDEQRPSWMSRLWPSSNDTKKDAETESMTLYSFLSTYPVPELGNKPLNPGGKLPYLVAISHCHYDHILGLEHFPTEPEHPKSSNGVPAVTVISSAYEPSFISPAYPNLNKHSLCESMGLKLPDYKIGYWAGNGEEIDWPPPADADDPKRKTTESRSEGEQIAKSTGIYTYHTPGHTPDSLSTYDAVARHLFIGDMIYERESEDTKAAGEPPMPIIFEGLSSLKDWFASITELERLVSEWNGQTSDSETAVVEVLNEINSSGDERQSPAEVLMYQYSLDESWIPVRKEANGTLIQVGKNSREFDSLVQLRFQDHDSPCGEEIEHAENDWTEIAILHRLKSLPRVKAGAAHVTTEADAEDLLASAKLFVHMVVDGKIPGKEMKNPYKPEVKLWYWCYMDENGEDTGRFSVAAPLSVIQELRGEVASGEDNVPMHRSGSSNAAAQVAIRKAWDCQNRIF